MNVQIFVYNCVFQKKEKQPAQNHISKKNHILKTKAHSETHFENDYLTPQYLYCCRIEAVKHRKVRSKSRTNAS